MQIIEKYIPKNKANRPQTPIFPTSITIHETDNTDKGAGALAHANYFATTTNKVSCHYVVDDTDVYQLLPINEMAYHSGDEAGNRTSIAIEICVNSDGNLKKAYDNAAELAAYLMRCHPRLQGKLKQHWDWTGKNCPRLLRKSGWSAFKARVTALAQPKPHVKYGDEQIVAKLIDDRAWCPVRELAEALGFIVEWDEKIKEVIIK